MTGVCSVEQMRANLRRPLTAWGRSELLSLAHTGCVTSVQASHSSKDEQTAAQTEAICHLLSAVEAQEMPVWALSRVCAELRKQLSENKPGRLESPFSEAVRSLRIRYTLSEGYILDDLKPILHKAMKANLVEVKPGAVIALKTDSGISSGRLPETDALPTADEWRTIRMALALEGSGAARSAAL